MFTKGSIKRQGIARQIEILRAHERAGGYETNSRKTDYNGYFKGFARSFEYVRQLYGTNLVLDIGAGTTRAIFEISKMPESRGLEFAATVLSYTQDINRYLRREHTHVTSAEILKGVENNSVGLVLAAYSITYSQNPAAAIDRINDVLAPGGIFKGKFMSCPKRNANTDLSIHCEPFELRLRNLGFDIAVAEHGLILAKKPGGNVNVTAQELFELDRQNMKWVNRTVRRIFETLREKPTELGLQE